MLLEGLPISGQKGEMNKWPLKKNLWADLKKTLLP
jgi:hypothetical protein